MFNDSHRKNKINRIASKWIRIRIKIERHIFLDIGTIIDIDKTFAIIFSRAEIELYFSVRQFDRNRLCHIFRQKAVIYKDWGAVSRDYRYIFKLISPYGC